MNCTCGPPSVAPAPAHLCPPNGHSLPNNNNPLACTPTRRWHKCSRACSISDLFCCSSPSAGPALPLPKLSLMLPPARPPSTPRRRALPARRLPARLASKRHPTVHTRPVESLTRCCNITGNGATQGGVSASTLARVPVPRQLLAASRHHGLHMPWMTTVHARAVILLRCGTASLCHDPFLRYTCVYATSRPPMRSVVRTCSSSVGHARGRGGKAGVSSQRAASTGARHCKLQTNWLHGQAGCF
jgi:hypothetical protein